jgi:hypothetical protein
MSKWRKKPVVVEAVVWDGSADLANRFIGERYGVDWWYESSSSPHIIIPAIGGNHFVSLGDYIIHGIKGDSYPCKPGIFLATYDPEPEA